MMKGEGKREALGWNRRPRGKAWKAGKPTPYYPFTRKGKNGQRRPMSLVVKGELRKNKNQKKQKPPNRK